MPFSRLEWKSQPPKVSVTNRTPASTSRRASRRSGPTGAGRSGRGAAGLPCGCRTPRGPRGSVTSAKASCVNRSRPPSGPRRRRRAGRCRTRRAGRGGPRAGAASMPAGQGQVGNLVAVGVRVAVGRERVVADPEVGRRRGSRGRGRPSACSAGRRRPASPACFGSLELGDDRRRPTGTAARGSTAFEPR